LRAGVIRAWEFARQLIQSLARHRALEHAAQLAYFAMLAIFPGAMFLLTVVGFLPLHGVDEAVVRSLHSVLPLEVAGLVETTLREIVGHRRAGLLVSTLLLAIWSGSDVANGLITTLNSAWHVRETRGFLRVRARAVVATLGGGLQILIATVAMFVGPELVHRVMTFLGFGGAFDRVWAVLRWPLALAALMTMTASAYHFLPNVRQRRRFLTFGSTVAVLAWLALSLGFRTWFTHFPTHSKVYGALGTVVILLVWLYWSALMIILGGEVNAIVGRMGLSSSR
jgi:membrane protein